jgi:hypothetical protein
MPVRWATTASKGKRIPLDIELSFDPCCGNFIVSGENIAYWISDADRLRLVKQGIGVYVPHASTCTRRRAW